MLFADLRVFPLSGRSELKKQDFHGKRDVETREIHWKFGRAGGTVETLTEEEKEREFLFSHHLKSGNSANTAQKSAKKKKEEKQRKRERDRRAAVLSAPVEARERRRRFR